MIENVGLLSSRSRCDVPVALSWKETKWNFSQKQALAWSFTKKQYKLRSKGWVGIRIRCMSNYEFEVICKAFPDHDKISFIRYPFDGITIVDKVNYLSESFEVMVETREMLVKLHKVLLSISKRSRYGIVGYPIDLSVKKTLKGLNHLWIERLNGGSSSILLSVQEFDGVDKLLAILALTR